ncbi:hypothetical protein DCE79_05605 [Lysinibacillus sp. 2017]|nr:hypothetical protein DCE79_05605 [Lysinibacillus sp. 2017]
MNKAKMYIWLVIIFFAIIFIVLPILFPHSIILNWVRNILFGILILGLTYDFIKSRTKSKIIS